MRNNTRMELSGNNILNFINLCNQKQIQLKKIKRINFDLLHFELDDINLNKLKKIDTTQYNLKLIKIGGIAKFKKIFTYRIGLVVGIICSIISSFLLNNRLLEVHIYGLTTLDKQIVVDKLEDIGIKKYNLMNFDCKKIESYLSYEFDFSLVSIITKGNSLIISIKEELPELHDNITPIYAQYDMVIKSIDVFAGTCLVKEGDIVRKGQVIVDNYFFKDYDKQIVKPSANIVAETYISSSYQFNNSEVVLVRTNNSNISQTSISLGKYLLFSSQKSCEYELYEDVNKEQFVSSYILPIKINKTIRYELKKEKIIHDYSIERESIITNLKKECYEKLTSELNLKDEKVVETSIKDGKIINVYLICDFECMY